VGEDVLITTKLQNEEVEVYLWPWHQHRTLWKFGPSSGHTHAVTEAQRLSSYEAGTISKGSEKAV